MSSDDHHADRSRQHNERLQEYIETQAVARAKFKRLADEYEEAVQAIIDSGALTIAATTEQSRKAGTTSMSIPIRNGIRQKRA